MTATENLCGTGNRKSSHGRDVETTEENPYLQLLKAAQANFAKSGTSITTTETLDDYDLGGVDCELCGNKGFLLSKGENGELLSKECECMSKRRSLRRIRKSGLSDMLTRYTFKNYEPVDDVRTHIKQTAIKFANTDSGWFYIAGQPGSGKTHICTAICARLINRGKDIYYMRWRDESRLYKSLINSEALEKPLNKLKSVYVLYIDDFFKCGSNEADVRIAFEIINARYNDSRLRTIISTEMTLEEILQVDEALGSRIYERSRGYVLTAPNENFRLK